MTVPLIRTLCSLGMSTLDAPLPCPVSSCYQVVLDGRVLGYLPRDIAPQVTARLKVLKVKEQNGVSLAPFGDQNIIARVPDRNPDM